MRNTIIAILVVLALCAGIACAADFEEHTEQTSSRYYALTTKVVKIDREADIVTCEDYNGNLWEFYGVEDWEIGDCASLLMDNHGTATITDDIIEATHFSAWTLTR